MLVAVGIWKAGAGDRWVGEKLCVDVMVEVRWNEPHCASMRFRSICVVLNAEKNTTLRKSPLTTEHSNNLRLILQFGEKGLINFLKQRLSCLQFNSDVYIKHPSAKYDLFL